ncbi:MAG: PPC domain-containing protein, partial [Nostocaceae cyanobacterium]|nr:PPC domain-containing protein [Nostocaceae cyanobacterium]
EGRHFSPFVDLNFYRAANFDLAAVGFNNQQLFEHLTNSGIAEGRRFSVSFDSSYYRNVDSNSDLAAAGLNSFQLFEHFQSSGLAEGRASSQSFNVTYYLGNNADLTAAGFNNVTALQHFEGVGFREGRVAEAIPLEDNRNDNTLGTALNLDVLSYNRTFSNQSVGTGDTDDFYRFLVADRSNLNISLSNVTSNAVVELIQDSNNNGQVDNGEVLFRRAAASGSNTAFQTGTLAGGTYFVRVAPDSGTSNTNYSVSMSANLVPPAIPRVPGTSPDNPLNIGTLSNGISTYRDVVSSAARDDYYQFTIANPTEFILSLTGLSGDSDVQIFQGNASAQASPLYGSYNRGNASESIRTFLEAGTYTIQVFSNDGSTNNYNLRLSANSSTPIETNNTLGTAFSFGNLTGNSLTLRQVVGINDAEDYYSFSLNSTSTVNMNYNATTVGTTIGAKLDLIYDSNGNGTIDSGDRVFANLSPGQINPTLGAGTYFVRIFTDVTPGTADSNYTLDLSATATPAPTLAPEPGNTRPFAANIGTLSGTRTFNDFVGSADREDFYAFTLASRSNVQLTLDQLNENAYLDVINNSGETLFRSYTSDTETTRFGSITQSLAAGNYFARVFTSSTAANTTYRLNLQSTVAS